MKLSGFVDQAKIKNHDPEFPGSGFKIRDPEKFHPKANFADKPCPFCECLVKILSLPDGKF